MSYEALFRTSHDHLSLQTNETTHADRRTFQMCQDRLPLLFLHKLQHQGGERQDWDWPMEQQQGDGKRVQGGQFCCLQDYGKGVEHEVRRHSRGASIDSLTEEKITQQMPEIQSLIKKGNGKKTIFISDENIFMVDALSNSRSSRYIAKKQCRRNSKYIFYVK